MKRGTNRWMLTLAGTVFIGLATTAMAEHSGPGADAAGTAVRRDAEGLAELDGTAYKGLIESLRASDEKEIKTTRTRINAEKEEFTVSAESVGKLYKWAQAYRKFRSDIELCSDKEKDPIAGRLAELMDSYAKSLRWALFNKDEKTKSEAKENEMVALTVQIKLLLNKRGEKLNDKSEFANDGEKKIATWLDSTLDFLFGSTDSDKERRAALSWEAQKTDAAFKKEAKKTVDAIAKGKEVDAEQMCKLAPAEKPAEPNAAVAEAKPEEKPASTTPVAPPVGNEQTVADGAATGISAADLESLESRLAARLANSTRKAEDEARIAADNLVRQAQEKQRLDAELALQQQKGDDQVAAAAIKALAAQAQNAQQVVPPPSTPVILPPQEQQQLPQIQAQPFQQQDLGQQQQPMPMPMMPYPQMPQPVQPAPVYAQGPSQFGNGPFMPYQSGLGLPGTGVNSTQVNPALASQMAVNQLLAMVRNPQMMGQNGMYGQQGMYGQPGMYGQSAYSQGPNTMSARIGLFGSSVRSSQRGSLSSMGSSTNSQNGLAIAPAGRSGGLPTAVRQTY